MSIYGVYYNIGNGLEEEFIEADSVDEALGKFFKLNTGLCYNDIVDHFEVGEARV